MPDLVFKVDSALLSELGEKLVERVHVALLELVKNAYDADATRVTVKIVPRQAGGPIVRVEDDGVGMTFDQVKQYWMRVATTNKILADTSDRFGRPRQGSKGIGRFSCRRLGTRLDLTTTARADGGGFERTHMSFDWKAFAPGTEITNIRCPGARECLEQAETGTKLVIEGAPHDEWSTRGYNYLKRQLAVLVANRGLEREGYQADPGFNIMLEAPGFGEEMVNLRDELITAGWGTVTGAVNPHGDTIFRLNALKIGSRTLQLRGAFPHLGGVSLRVGVLVEGRDQMRRTDVISKGTLGEILNDWGGVYVRFKGFRVPPYGEAGNDWLHVDRDRGLRRGAVGVDLVALASRLRDVDPKRALLSLLNFRNYVGDVEISSAATGFEMKSNREGFVSGPAADELAKFVRLGIDWATIYRDFYIRLNAREESATARAAFERTSETTTTPEHVAKDAIAYIRSETKTLAAALPLKERQQVQRAVTSATEAILKHEASNREELRHLRLIAATSTLLLIFSHEVKSLIGELEHSRVALRNLQSGLDESKARKVSELQSELKNTKERFLDLLGMTSLIAIDSRRASPERLALAERLNTATRCFQLIIDSYGINVDLTDVPNKTKVGPILEAELYAIALNVLSNSIKSVIAAGKVKRVKVTASALEQGTVINILDTGVGLPELYFGEVFVPFVADPQGTLYPGLDEHLNPEDRYIVGTGSGLGLSIIREIIQARGGSVAFRIPEGDWKSNLEIILP